MMNIYMLNHNNNNSSTLNDLTNHILFVYYW